MIDLELRRTRPQHKGLNVELSPGRPPTSPSASAWVSEDAFGFLEPSVKRLCSNYREMSHWGVTEVRREEWLVIAEDWRRLALALDRADSPLDYADDVWLFSDEAKLEFSENFSALKIGLSKLIGDLDNWIYRTVTEHECIFIKGI
jgi:hypothetical protein